MPSGASSSTLSSSFLGASESDTSCALLAALGLILTEKADARLEQQRVLATERRAVHLILVAESVKKWATRRARRIEGCVGPIMHS